MTLCPSATVGVPGAPITVEVGAEARPQVRHALRSVLQVFPLAVTVGVDAVGV